MRRPVGTDPVNDTPATSGGRTVPPRGAVTDEHLQYAGRDAGLFGEFREAVRRKQRQLGGFHDYGVAAGQWRGDAGHEGVCRPVPRKDDGVDAEGLEQTRVALERDRRTGALPPDADAEVMHAMTAATYMGYGIFREVIARDLGISPTELDRRAEAIFDRFVDALQRDDARSDEDPRHESPGA